MPLKSDLELIEILDSEKLTIERVATLMHSPLAYAVFNADREPCDQVSASYDDKRSCYAFIAGYKAAIARAEEL